MARLAAIAQAQSNWLRSVVQNGNMADPNQILDRAHEHTLAQLRQVRREIAQVMVEKERLSSEASRLRHRIAEASSDNTGALARQLQEREAHCEELESRHQQLLAGEWHCARKVEELPVRKAILKASLRIAQAHMLLVEQPATEVLSACQSSKQATAGLTRVRGAIKDVETVIEYIQLYRAKVNQEELHFREQARPAFEVDRGGTTGQARQQHAEIRSQLCNLDINIEELRTQLQPIQFGEQRLAETLIIRRGNPRD